MLYHRYDCASVWKSILNMQLANTKFLLLAKKPEKAHLVQTAKYTWKKPSAINRVNLLLCTNYTSHKYQNRINGIFISAQTLKQKVDCLAIVKRFCRRFASFRCVCITQSNTQDKVHKCDWYLVMNMQNNEPFHIIHLSKPVHQPDTVLCGKFHLESANERKNRRMKKKKQSIKLIYRTNSKLTYMEVNAIAMHRTSFTVFQFSFAAFLVFIWFSLFSTHFVFCQSSYRKVFGMCICRCWFIMCNVLPRCLKTSHKTCIETKNIRIICERVRYQPSGYHQAMYKYMFHI